MRRVGGARTHPARCTRAPGLAASATSRAWPYKALTASRRHQFDRPIRCSAAAVGELIHTGTHKVPFFFRVLRSTPLWHPMGHILDTKEERDMTSTTSRELTVEDLDQVSGGFELIELLVVIPVIGELVALLLPPIQKAPTAPVHKGH